MEQRWIEIPQLVKWFLEVKTDAIEQANIQKTAQGYMRNTEANGRKSRLR